jgi:hypothetical protein
MANDLTEEELGDLAFLHKQASPGCVSIERRDDDDGSVDHILHGARGDVAACFETANANSRANAAFIEALWNAFPALLSMARRAAKAEGELAEALATIESMKPVIDQMLTKSVHADAADLEVASLRAELDRVTKERDGLKAELAQWQAAHEASPGEGEVSTRPCQHTHTAKVSDGRFCLDCRKDL